MFYLWYKCLTFSVGVGVMWWLFDTGLDTHTFNLLRWINFFLMTMFIGPAIVLALLVAGAMWLRKP